MLETSEFQRVNDDEDSLQAQLKLQLRKAAFDDYENFKGLEMTTDSAIKYADSLGNSGSFSANINSVNLERETCVLSWIRTDSRVSKEVFVVKLNMSINAQSRYISIEHNQGRQQKKITVKTKNIMGLNITDKNLIIRIYGMPELLVKQNKWQSQHLDSPETTTASSTLIVEFGKNKSLPNYVHLFHLDEKLQAAMASGIKEQYPEFTIGDSRPEDLLPIVKDPLLVREAQLVVLELLQDQRSEDVQWLIQAYLSLYSEFKKLLKKRLEKPLPGHEQ